MMFKNSAGDGSTSSGSAPGSGGAASGTPNLTSEEKLARAELVRSKTGVTFEEARNALEACGYDALDAIVLLERQGKTASQTAHYTTSGSSADAQTHEEMAQAQTEFESSTKPGGFGAACAKAFEWLKKVLRRSIEITFVVSHRGERLFSVPLLVLVVLLIPLFWVIVPLVIVGLFFEFRYRFDGIGTVTVDVNEWSRKASDGAEQLKHTVADGYAEATASDGADAGTSKR